jgi:hypothetical protein
MYRGFSIPSSFPLTWKIRHPPSASHQVCRFFSSYKSNKMAKTVQEALKEGELFTDNLRYTFLKLPVSSLDKASTLFSSKSSYSSAFRGLLLDKDEITMMIPQEDWNAYHQKAAERPAGEPWEVGTSAYRLITFDVVMDPNLIGFMYNVTKVLAAEKISVLPFAAYSRDHIFVQEKDYEKTMTALERLKNHASDLA